MPVSNSSNAPADYSALVSQYNSLQTTAYTSQSVDQGTLQAFKSQVDSFVAGSGSSPSSQSLVSQIDASLAVMSSAVDLQQTQGQTSNAAWDSAQQDLQSLLAEIAPPGSSDAIWAPGSATTSGKTSSDSSGSSDTSSVSTPSTSSASSGPTTFSSPSTPPPAANTLLTASQLPPGSDVAKAASAPNVQTKATGDGGVVVFTPASGSTAASLAIFNSLGHQTATTQGNVTISGPGSIALGNGQFLNYSADGLTVDDINKNSDLADSFNADGTINSNSGFTPASMTNPTSTSISTDSSASSFSAPPPAPNTLLSASQLPAGSAVANAAAQPGVQVKALGDGGVVVFWPKSGSTEASMALFNNLGQQTTQRDNLDADAASTRLSNGQFINHSQDGITVDNVAKSTDIWAFQTNGKLTWDDGATTPGSFTNSYAGSMNTLLQDSSLPANSDLSKKVTSLGGSSDNTSVKSLGNGNYVLFNKSGNTSSFAIYNGAGQQTAPSNGLQTIDPLKNSGNGTVDLGNNQYINFGLGGLTVDNTNKNPGKPFTINADGTLKDNG